MKPVPDKESSRFSRREEFSDGDNDCEELTQCAYSKIESVVINCSLAWRISNKLSVKSRIHKLFVALPGSMLQYHNNISGECETDVYAYEF
jgi:hypothetical protein